MCHPSKPRAAKCRSHYAYDIKCANGSNHPDNILALTNQADVLHAPGKLTLAERHYLQAAQEAERIFGLRHAASIAATELHSHVKRELSQSTAVP
jgi:hypothetical protein